MACTRRRWYERLASCLTEVAYTGPQIGPLVGQVRTGGVCEGPRRSIRRRRYALAFREVIVFCRAALIQAAL